MTTMLQRIRERAAFDQAKVSLNAIEQMKMGVAIDSAYIRGAREENGYLLPLIDALIQAVGEAEKGLEESASRWFNRNDPTDPYHDCACMGCDMGGAGEKVDERGHDVTCPISLAGKARASMQSILEKAMK